MTEATTAAIERARTMPLDRADTASAVIRIIQDAALVKLDREIADGVRAVDVRFDKFARDLRIEAAASRQTAPAEPVRIKQRFLLDALGGLLAAGAMATSIDAGIQSDGWMQRSEVLAPFVAGLLVLALLAHAVNGLLARKPGSTAAQGRMILLFTSGFSVISAGGLLLREAGGASLDLLVPSVVVAALVAIAAVLLWFGRAADAREYRDAVAGGATDSRSNGDLRARLRVEQHASSAETGAHFDELDPDARAAFDAAVAEGVSAVIARGVLVPQVVRALRGKDLAAVRYDVSL
ncbi:hypothetical protein [Agromyces allii]|uniref:Uncharacterized protein n=1 Tax=Agromyces allii TaxID=393607 RepID=A0ABP5BG75_9MICO|nr:hypothetical protein [Agromyces allii]